MLFIITTILFGISSGVWYIFSKNRRFIPKSKIPSYYNLGQKIHDILSQYEVRYFIVAGTLLGAARSKSIIPWDNDMDIGILEEDIPKLEQIPWENTELGFVSHRVGKDEINIGRFHHKGEECCEKWGNAFCDYFVYRQDSKGVYRHAGKYALKSWPNEYFLEHELFPRQLYEFGTVRLFGPHQYDPYLTRSYGNWRVPRTQ